MVYHMDHATHAEQLPRLKRLHGQVGGIIKMVEEGRYCVDLLTQTRAVRAAMRKVEESILKKHLEHCVGQALASDGEDEKQQKLDEMYDVIKSFMA